MNCDFCDVEIKHDGEGSAFCDGSAFSNLGIDERVSCAECCGKIQAITWVEWRNIEISKRFGVPLKVVLEKEEQTSFLYKKDWGMNDD